MPDIATYKSLSPSLAAKYDNLAQFGQRFIADSIRVMPTTERSMQAWRTGQRLVFSPVVAFAYYQRLAMVREATRD